MTSPVLLAALYDTRKTQHALKATQDYLSRGIKYELQNNPDGFANLLEFVDKNKASVEEFTNILAAYRAAGNRVIPQISSHKMNEILTGVAGQIETMLDAHELDDYPMSNATNFWGSPNVTYLNAALEIAYLSLSGKTAKDIAFQSPINQKLPLPAELDLPLECGSFFYEEAGQKYFTTVHEGFAFGGGRRGVDLGKTYPAYDASSFTAYISGSPISYSSADQLCAYRVLKGNGGFIPEAWFSGPEPSDMTSRYSAVSVEAAERGVAWVQRSGMKPGTLGTSGGTGIVSNMYQDGTCDVVTYFRDIPKEAGFGKINVKSISCNDPQLGEREIFFLKVAEGSMSSVQHYDKFAGAEYEAGASIESIVAYFDSRFFTSEIPEAKLFGELAQVDID